MVDFDVEMIDYDDFADQTRIRVSTSDTNRDLATGTVSWNEDGSSILTFDQKIADPERAREAVLSAIQAELDVHQRARPNEYETLRELFADVTPSGSVPLEAFAPVEA